MNRHRAGEMRAPPFRSERLYSSNSLWFFLVRGGDSQGPFDSRDAAQRALDGFISKQMDRARADLQESH